MNNHEIRCDVFLAVGSMCLHDLNHGHLLDDGGTKHGSHRAHSNRSLSMAGGHGIKTSVHQLPEGRVCVTWLLSNLLFN